MEVTDIINQWFEVCQPAGSLTHTPDLSLRIVTGKLLQKLVRPGIAQKGAIFQGPRDLSWNPVRGLDWTCRGARAWRCHGQDPRVGGQRF